MKKNVWLHKVTEKQPEMTLDVRNEMIVVTKHRCHSMSEIEIVEDVEFTVCLFWFE